MTDYPLHQRLRLTNFTAFKDITLEFVPGVNTFVGENGTGKTHIMKAMYAMQRLMSRQNKRMTEILNELFQTEDPQYLVRLDADNGAVAEAAGEYNGRNWGYTVHRSMPAATFQDNVSPTVVERPVFIPAIDMMGHTKGFLAAANEVVLDFDLTCSDIVTLLGLKRNNSLRAYHQNDALAALLGGFIERNEEDGRYYLATPMGRLPMPMVAEGLRKIAALVQLQNNGWLSRGTTLFWDEPEVNLNPKLMDEVVAAILTMARSGIQVFLATHSYVILKELDLQATPADSIRYFGFQRSNEGTTANATDDFTLLDPNPILEQYNSLYDRELTRATGRNRKGERVR